MRHEVNNLESSVVVQELEFAINCALYGVLSFLCSFHKFHSETSAFQFISFASLKKFKRLRLVRATHARHTNGDHCRLYPMLLHKNRSACNKINISILMKLNHCGETMVRGHSK